MKSSAPKPTGEYAVGTFTYTVKDDREEVMKPSTMRSVASRVYYPVLKEQTEGLKKARYMSRNMMTGLRKGFMIPLNYRKLEASGENRSECYVDAPRIGGKRFPLIVFHHGLGSFREGNSFLCIELASHGYVVLCVAHSMEGLCTEFDDGTYEFFDKSISKKSYQPLLGGLIAAFRLTRAKGSDEELAAKFESLQDRYCAFLKGRPQEWVKDTKAALDYAKKNLADLINFEKGIGVSGLSLGGDTAYALCLDDPEYVCGINIDGAPFGDYQGKVLKKPFLQVSCRDNEKVVTRVYLRHTAPVYKVLFRDMRHVGFSDMKFRIRSGAMVGRLDADAMHENLCRCHLEMFDTYLKGTKDRPDIRSNDVITVTEYAPEVENGF